MAQVIPVVALAAIVEVRAILSPRRQKRTEGTITDGDVDDASIRISSRSEAPPLQTTILAFLVFALTILSAGEMRALLVVFGFGSNIGAVFMDAKNELLATLIVATNLIFLAPAGQALAVLVARWNASAAEAPGNVDSDRKRRVKNSLRLGALLALLIALYLRVIVLA